MFFAFWAMKILLRNPRVLVIAVLFGLIISASYYVIRPLDSQLSSERIVSPLMWPIELISLLTIMPRIFVARIIWEALGTPEWLGEVLFLLYWPFLGAVLGVCKHWILWGVVILGINIGLLAWFLYELPRMKFTFF